MLWLKQLDFLSSAVPRALATARPPQLLERSSWCAVRPGGLGDLVLLTRAALSRDINPLDGLWICERRNSPWAAYLGLPHFCYDSISSFCAVLLGRYGHMTVINSEQTFGLAALFSARLVAQGGGHFGFVTNRRHDLFTAVLSYDPGEEHEIDAFSRLFGVACANQPPSARGTFVVPEVQYFLDNTASVSVIAIAGLQAEYKRLPVEIWLQLAKRAKNYSSEIYLVGAKCDRWFAEQLVECATFPLINTVGELSFSQTVDLIRSSVRLFSVDSGLVHVADFFAVPSDVVFASPNYKKWLPRTAGSTVLFGSTLTEQIIK